ncbi:MAG: metallophosphoesterase [Clostridia bacterium]|nr:metallophosphoesterase [Clostridia bacterium]
MSVFIKKVTVFITCFSLLLTPLLASVIHGGEKAFFEKWSADAEFTRDYAVELEKDPDRDFVVLNLADIQLGDEQFEETGALVKAQTDRMISELKPDLITLSGDNAVSFLAYMDLVKWIDSYGIPWAPVMGNHDGQGCPSEFWCAYDFTMGKNCLFKFGPADMGYGNYVINITENGEIIHTLFMMDTHSDIEEDGNINGEKGSGYDHFWKGQFDWYSWAVDGIKTIAGRTVESSIIIHIPLYEYRDAYAEATGGANWNENHDLPFVGEYAETSFGAMHEGICCAPQNNGFFDLMLEKGSTKNVICGHDHVNDFSILYRGVRLSYALKDGPGCYWEENMNGCTTLSVASDGSATVEHHFYDINAE